MSKTTTRIPLEIESLDELRRRYAESLSRGVVELSSEAELPAGAICEVILIHPTNGLMHPLAARAAGRTSDGRAICRIEGFDETTDAALREFIGPTDLAPATATNDAAFDTDPEPTTTRAEGAGFAFEIDDPEPPTTRENVTGFGFEIAASEPERERKFHAVASVALVRRVETALGDGSTAPRSDPSPRLLFDEEEEPDDAPLRSPSTDPTHRPEVPVHSLPVGELVGAGRLGDDTTRMDISDLPQGPRNRDRPDDEPQEVILPATGVRRPSQVPVPAAVPATEARRPSQIPAPDTIPAADPSRPSQIPAPDTIPATDPSRLDQGAAAAEAPPSAPDAPVPGETVEDGPDLVFDPIPGVGAVQVESRPSPGSTSDEDGEDGEMVFDPIKPDRPERSVEDELPANLHERLRKLPIHELHKIARQGHLTERVALERIYGKAVWEPLLQNPNLTPPEVARIARMGTLPRPMIETIVSRPNWLSSALIRRALLSNPKLAGRSLTKVLRSTPKAELDLVPQQTAYPPRVREAAKRILGRR